MPDHAQVPLTKIHISYESPVYKQIANWPFQDQYISRLMCKDIPIREQYGNCQIWVYKDQQGELVGFGTIDVCKDYEAITNGLSHLYLPLLAVNPTIKSLGYGSQILGHLIDEAAMRLSNSPGWHDALFLDVYTSNERAIKLYQRFGFEQVVGPACDPLEDGKLYIVMAKRVAITG